MPRLKSILDSPLPKTGQKIRKFYFLVIDFLILGYTICLFFGALSVGLYTYYSENEFFMCLFFSIVFSIVYFYTFRDIISFFYSWYKASSKYDLTFDKEIMDDFSISTIETLDKEKNTSQNLARKTYGNSVFILIVSSSSALFQTWSDNNIDRIISLIILSLVVYSIVVILYCFSINKLIDKLLS